MRILVAVVVLAALGWSGFWWVSSSTVERNLRAWVEARAAEGWVVNYDSLSTGGFPNRVDTTITGLELADPETGVSWSAPMFQILALSYKPNHVILAWPPEQTFATPFETVTITSQTMRGSAVFVPGIDLTLDHATIEADRLGLVSTAGWSASLAKGLLSTRRTPAVANSYDVALSVQELRLPDGFARLLSGRSLIGDTLGTLSLDATVLFDAPWDRRAVELRRPQPRSIDLKLAQATWGELDLKLAGRVDVDGEGLPTGEIMVKATNWREMLRLAVASGAIAENLAPLVENGLEGLARLSGSSGDALDVPLTFARGRVMLAGLVPLGPAPRLVLR